MTRLRLASTLIGLVAIGTVGLPAVATADDAPPPASLLAGQSLVADSDHDMLANDRYTLTVGSGIVMLDEHYRKTASSTGSWFADGGQDIEHDHSRLVLRRNGDLVLLDERGHRLWHTGTKGSGAVRLTVHRSGNLALHTESGRVVWETHSGRVFLWAGQSLEPGQRLAFAWDVERKGGTLRTLTMQRDGRLVYRCGKNVVWQTRTHVRSSSLHLYRDGALRIIGPHGRTVWASHSGGHRHGDDIYLHSGSLTIEHWADYTIWSPEFDYTLC